MPGDKHVTSIQRELLDGGGHRIHKCPLAQPSQILSAPDCGHCPGVRPQARQLPWCRGNGWGPFLLQVLTLVSVSMMPVRTAFPTGALDCDSDLRCWPGCGWFWGFTWQQLSSYPLLSTLLTFQVWAWECTSAVTSAPLP